MDFKDFDKIRLDAIREISSMATGHAATSLSTMLNSRVSITVPTVLFEPVENLPELLGGPGQISVVIYFVVSGTISGAIILVLSSKEALKLADILTGQKATRIEDMDELGFSALKEFGNIVTGSYIRVLAQGLKMKLSHTIPGFSYDMLGSSLDEIIAGLAFTTDHAIIVESEYIIKKDAYGGHIVFVFGPKDLGIIITALGTSKE